MKQPNTITITHRTARLIYVDGWRWGWLCGATAGALLGMLAMWALIELSRLLGAAP